MLLLWTDCTPVFTWHMLCVRQLAGRKLHQNWQGGWYNSTMFGAAHGCISSTYIALVFWMPLADDAVTGVLYSPGSGGFGWVVGRGVVAR
jgi:hypothetical protein